MERLINIPKIISYYLYTFLFPKDLALSQQWVVHSLSLSTFFLPLLFLCLLISLGIYFNLHVSQKEKRIYYFFIAWVVLGLLALSQIFPLDMTVAERWFYFPMIGVLGIIGLVIHKYYQLILKYKLPVGIVLIILATMLSVRTVIRNFNWSDPISLYAHDTSINTDSYTLENEYGYSLAMNNKFSDAEQHFNKSIALAPDWYTNWSNLGVLYFKEGNTQKAKQYLLKAIKNGDDGSYVFLATIYIFYDHDYKTAASFLSASVQAYPQSALLWQQFALAEYGLGNKDQALQAANNAYTLSPDQKNYSLVVDLTNNVPINLKPQQN